MGSGCNNKKISNQCVDTVSSDCVIYQGDPIDILGICTGDTITEVLEIILLKLQNIAIGKGIKLNDLIIGCSDLNLQYQNSDKELITVLNMILEKECDLQEQIDDLKVQVNNPSTALTVDLKCLPNTAITRSLFDQALVDKLCLLQDKIDQLEAQIPSNTNITNVVTDVLIDKLNSCNGGIEVTGTGVNRELNFKGIIPVGGVFFTIVSSSKFDSTGKGIDEWCNYAIANGKNGTRNMGNRTLAMATASVPGLTGSFPTARIPGDTAGEETVTLQSNQLPNHSHSVSQTPHQHTVVAYGSTVFYDSASGSKFGDFMKHSPNAAPTLTTSSSMANISVGGVNGGSGQAHNNLQPTLFGLWIQRIS